MSFEDLDILKLELNRMKEANNSLKTKLGQIFTFLTTLGGGIAIIGFTSVITVFTLDFFSIGAFVCFFVTFILLIFGFLPIRTELNTGNEFIDEVIATLTPDQNNQVKIDKNKYYSSQILNMRSINKSFFNILLWSSIFLILTILFLVAYDIESIL